MIKLLLLLSIFYSPVKDIYYVTFVKGEARLAGNNKTLSVGDKITDTDKLIFRDKNGRLSCISPTRGRFDLSLEKSTQNEQKEWIAVLKNVLVQSSSTKQLSTRDIPGEMNDPAILFKSNSPENKMLIVENQLINTNSGYLLDEKNFLFLKYMVNGVAMLKKVPTRGQAYYFDSSVFVNNRNESLAPEKIGTVSLCYQQMKNGAPVSRVIIKFLPVLISKLDLKKQLSLLTENLTLIGIKKEQINNEAYNHFCTNYGFLHPSLFKQIIEE
ncbi:MAG: hypothetical protein ABIN01_23600 [Ferruginibacter sp.]